jgi:hypothetical protein
VLIDFRIPVSQETLTAVSRIDRFRGQWPATATVPIERLTRIKEAATVQSVASSCRLSGMPVSDTEVLAVLRGEAAVADSAAIRGYASGLEWPFPANDRFVDQEVLQALNRAILDRADEPATGGEWRTQELNREAFDAEGHALGWIFPTLPPRLIKEKIDDLLTWLDNTPCWSSVRSSWPFWRSARSSMATAGPLAR